MENNNFVQVVPNSQSFTDLNQIETCLSSKFFDKEYILQGIQNTIKNGYELKQNLDYVKDNLIVTIEKVKYSGKWIEFWFQEDYVTVSGNPGDYHLSSKVYKLDEVMNKAGLHDYIMSNGMRGLKMLWKKEGYNWEIDSFIETQTYKL